MNLKYYVYHVNLGGKVVYVGKGQGERYKHATSGGSHNPKLNMLIAKHELLGEDKPVTKIVAYFEKEGQALDFEESQIKDHKPFCNNRLLTEKVLESPTKSYNKDNIILRNGFYHFNKRFGKKHMRCSLRTKNKSEALYMANLVLLQINKLYGVRPFTSKDVRAIVFKVREDLDLFTTNLKGGFEL